MGQQVWLTGKQVKAGSRLFTAALNAYDAMKDL